MSVYFGANRVVWFIFYWFLLSILLSAVLSRAIAQAVIHRLLTAEPRVRAKVTSCGICAWQISTGAGFLPVLRFPLPILIPPTAPHSSSILWGWYNRPKSGRRTKWTQSHPAPRNLKKKSSAVLAESRTEHTANTGLDRCHYTKPFDDAM
jgi:hypothetical protein